MRNFSVAEEWVEAAAPINSANPRTVRRLTEPDDPSHASTDPDSPHLCSYLLHPVVDSVFDIFKTPLIKCFPHPAAFSIHFTPHPSTTMFSSSTKTQLLAVLVALSSSVAASDLDARASTLTLPDIFKNATAQVTSLRQQLQRAIVFNSTLNAEPAYVQSVLSQVDAVIGNTAAQINQIGKLPFDQVSGGLTESDIQYVSTEFLTAVSVSLIAPQSVAEKYPEIQKSIDSIQ
ncbi:hypothetical protein M407DRAFT_26741 [Tulasnella calospora MUT 4182]|uniref:Uncharacterized protein n=1 Tax=Tulasnella calospora MUT 4182 TaxID=1051891 RepID=A0A0C3LQX4_9AGAM|nr:hypothetical protein M407DRAFT_26741 [Tulasnella calospora MUT 4182]